ncbi:dihydrofolate reductase [Sphaerospermopsis aphanizomenoides BCCUSP55]|uniref:dihydrofolate reductase family protein n=1 Tax=Sphaerospermopsis aphanizomenoides TaxID=459663 RepID=UPI001904F83B|nr:dihydrofolate reductase family protein [Sphaerospermopsis aphanizomenoides]MBK1988858.1 dihydrofolate reductase [Sphaerospermopsis aphanizomenoides BCCUSP55]
MRKIRLFIASSLDGYIASKSGDVDWLFTDHDYGYSEFFNSIDTLIMGSKTYHQILGFGEYPYPGKKAFVVSKTRHGGQDDHVQFVGENLESFIKNLRSSSGGDIWLVGGSQVIEYFLEYGFLDEIILAIHPIILGEGIPLFVNNPSIHKTLNLRNVKTYDSGLLQVYYQIDN